MEVSREKTKIVWLKKMSKEKNKMEEKRMIGVGDKLWEAVKKEVKKRGRKVIGITNKQTNKIGKLVWNEK